MPFGLGQCAALLYVAPGVPCCWSPGRYPRSQLKLVYKFFHPNSFSCLFVWAGNFIIYYTFPDFISFPCINHLSISSSVTKSMHSPNPRPIVSILILFTKLFSCFLCVLVIFSIGTRVAVLWFLLFAVSLRYLACMFYFLQIAVYVIGGYVRLIFLLPFTVLLNLLPRCPSPPLHHHAVHPYSPPLLSTHLCSLPLLWARAVKLLCPVVLLAFRAQSLPTHHLSDLANLPPLPVPPLSIDTHYPLFFKCRSRSFAPLSD